MSIRNPGKCRKKKYRRVIHPAEKAKTADALLKMSHIPKTGIFGTEEDTEVEDEEYEDVDHEAELDLDGELGAEI